METKIMITAMLPALNDYKPVTEDKVREFRANGHVLTRGVLSPEEVKVYHDVIVEAAGKYNTEKRKLEDRDTYGKAFLQIMNLWLVDERVRKFVLAKRFGKMAADLLGVENVRIYHDQALFKEPHGGPTPWHQDQYYWPLDTDNTVTMWMPLVDISIDMGMLTFASTSHKNGLPFDIEISDESEAEYNSYVARSNFPVSRATSMKAGDATWHYGNTIHNAPGNNSDVMRSVMTVIYFADGAKISRPRNSWQEKDREKWFMGLPPGEPASSSINPRVL